MGVQQKPHRECGRSALMSPAVGQSGNKAKPAAGLAFGIKAHRRRTSVGPIIEHRNENTICVSPDDDLERAASAARRMRQCIRDKLAGKQHCRVRKRASVQNTRDEPAGLRHPRRLPAEDTRPRHCAGRRARTGQHRRHQPHPAPSHGLRACREPPP
jgi:hypothetical protein